MKDTSAKVRLKARVSGDYSRLGKGRVSLHFLYSTLSIYCGTKPTVPVSGESTLSRSFFFLHSVVACVSVTTKFFECNEN